MLTLPEIEEAELVMDGPLPCGHSKHNTIGHQHDTGYATHYVIALHDCDGGAPEVYPACARWVAYVLEHQDRSWLCGCGHIGAGYTMARVLQPV